MRLREVRFAVQAAPRQNLRGVLPRRPEHHSRMPVFGGSAAAHVLGRTHTVRADRTVSAGHHGVAGRAELADTSSLVRCSRDRHAHRRRPPERPRETRAQPRRTAAPRCIPETGLCRWPQGATRAEASGVGTADTGHHGCQHRPKRCGCRNPRVRRMRQAGHAPPLRVRLRQMLLQPVMLCPAQQPRARTESLSPTPRSPAR